MSGIELTLPLYDPTRWEMQEQMDAQVAALSQPVQWWMNWMMLIFFVSIVFVWRHAEARWTFGTMLATIPVAMGIFYVWRNVHLFSLAHWLLWAPLAAYLIHRWRYADDEKYRRWSPYRVWFTLLLATICVSLAFDARDIYLVITGPKATPPSSPLAARDPAPSYGVDLLP